MSRETQHLNGAATAGNVNRDFSFSGINPWQILYGQVVLTTDATVANRRVKLQVLDESSNLVFDVHSGATVPASQTLQHHEFMQGIYRETSFVGSALQVPIGHQMLLTNEWTLRITIENGQAGDSYTCNFLALEYK